MADTLSILISPMGFSFAQWQTCRLHLRVTATRLHRWPEELHWCSYVHSRTRLRHHSLSVGGVAHWGDKNNCVELQPITLLCLFIAEVLCSEAALTLSSSYWHSILNQKNSNHFILITLILGFCFAVCDSAWLKKTEQMCIKHACM